MQKTVIIHTKQLQSLIFWGSINAGNCNIRVQESKVKPEVGYDLPMIISEFYSVNNNSNISVVLNEIPHSTQCPKKIWLFEQWLNIPGQWGRVISFTTKVTIVSNSTTVIFWTILPWQASSTCELNTTNTCNCKIDFRPWTFLGKAISAMYFLNLD